MSAHLSLRKPYAVLAGIAVLGWVFFFFRSEYFELKDIEVQASGGIITKSDLLPVVFQVLDTRPARPWAKRQTVFLPVRTLEEGIKSSLYAEDVEIEKVSRNILRLNISFGSRFIYTTQNGIDFQRCAVARPEGIALEDALTLAATRKRYLLSPDFTTQDLDGIVYVRKTTSTLETASIKKLLDLGRVLDEQKVSFAYIEEDTGRGVAVQLDRDRQVLMDLDQPLQDQVERSQAILREKDYKEVKPLTIDLRIPGRAYLR